MDSPTRDELKALLKSRASSAVKQEKLDKVKSDLEKILEPSGIDPDTFIKNVLKNNGK